MNNNSKNSSATTEQNNAETKNQSVKSYENVGAEFFDSFWKESWTYIRTVVDVVGEPIIILDDTCEVLAANEAFYRLFQADKEDTEGKNIYKLGNGQWDIKELRNLLEDILPENTFFKGFEVKHEFPTIGHRTIILNARRIYSKDKVNGELFPPIIMIAMEDVSELMSIATRLSQYTTQLENSLENQSKKMEAKINRLEKKIAALKKK